MSSPKKPSKTNTDQKLYRLPKATYIIFIIIAFLAIGIPIFALISSIIYSVAIPADTPLEKLIKYIFILITGSILCLLIIAPIGHFIGKQRAKYQIHREDKAIQNNNPYQYYKELPNQFGVGVASLLGNSTIENEKDIIAALLDLCAQGYLHLSKHSDHYVIYPVQNPARTPLSNEAYLLQLIHQNNLKNIDFHKWYQLCVQDGVNLGLFHKIKLPKEKPTRRSKHHSDRSAKIVMSLFALGFIIVIIVSLLASSDILPKDIVNIMLGCVFGAMALYAIVIGLGSIFSAIRELFQATNSVSYKDTLEKHLHRTPTGITELQKLLAFRAFLAQFNTFVDKDPEAVILWDRYISYAQVFGLAQELMRSGYSQLVDNAAFKIDDINNITFHNLQVSTNPKTN